MRYLFDLFAKFADQMTLGSNKNLFYGFDKNEHKKQESNEVMNGFIREDNLQTIDLADERLESNNYETPSKRARIEATNSRQPIISSNLSTNRQKPKTSLMSKPMKFLQNTWNRFRGKDDQNEDTIETNDNSEEVMPSSSGTNYIQTNATIIGATVPKKIDSSNSFILSHFSKKLIGSRKRRFEKYSDLNEKRQYQQLLSRHKTTDMKHNLSSKVEIKCAVPPVIDLTSDKSMLSSNSLMKTSDKTYERQTLDESSKIDIITRLRSKPVVAPVLSPINTSDRSLKFKTVSNLSLNLIPSRLSNSKLRFDPKPSQPLLKTPESSEKALSVPSLPESSKKFNDLVETKKKLWSDRFVTDLRSSLIASNESIDNQISKSEYVLSQFQIKRQTDCQSLSDKFKRPLTKQELYPFIPFIGFDDRIDDIEEEDDEEETTPFDFPVLTPDMNREIDAALKASPPNEVLSEGFTIQICRKDMETLKGLNWLNDEIINFYFALIAERGKNDNYPSVHYFNTFFYKKLKDGGPQSLKRWTRKVDVFANDFIFIPIHLGMHWCLAVIDFIHKNIDYYDSMGGNNIECVQSIKSWLQAESVDKKKRQYSMTEWSLQMVKDIPQQMNGSDCGMFSCKYAEYIARKAKINFSQAHMPYFRRRMVYEILTKQLL